jgi:hypothetical protein
MVAVCALSVWSVPSRRTQKQSIFSVQAENADGAVYRYRYEPHDDF